jgi:hypothetical protein
MTTFDFLNDMRAEEFGIVNVFNMDKSNSAFNAVHAADTNTNQNALTFNRRGAQDTVGTSYEGTDTLALTGTQEQGELHNTVITADIGATTGWLMIDGVLADTDTADGLDAGDSTLLRVGAAARDASQKTLGSFGFTAILDFSAVTDTIDATWSTDLSIAINTAALSSNYNAHSIAAAIFDYDNNITGTYYALNELSSGDASNCYLLAYDIATQTAITQGFYGLTSTSGVTGTILVPGAGIGMYGPNKSMYGEVESVYGTPSSIYGTKQSIFGSN